MKKWQKIPKFVRLMILEEYRMNAAMIGRFQFMFFPVMIAIFALILSISAPVLLKSLPVHYIYFDLHLVLLIYGLGVGGFALFGESIAERRFGQLNLLLETPVLQPIDFKLIFLVFYIKDSIYYILFSIIPITAGIALSIPITGFKLTSVLILFFSSSLTFMFGLSLSFFISSLYVRWRAIFSAVMLFLLILITGAIITDLYDLENLIPSLMFQYNHEPLYLGLSLVMILIFSTVAVKFIKIEFGKRSERYSPAVFETKEQFSFTRSYSTYISKEWLDMKRSRTLYPVIGAYIGPLIFLSVILWVLGSVLEIPIEFNIVFFAGMIGFFGMTIYSWLNIIDSPEFYQVLPVSVPLVIKTKLILFGILTSAISTVFLVVLSILNRELDILWLSLIVSFTTTSYTVIATAFLTGLRTNTYLFSPKVLGKFTGMVALPLIIITIISFILPDKFIVAIGMILFICVLLNSGSILMYRNLETKWGSETFSFQ